MTIEQLEQLMERHKIMVGERMREKNLMENAKITFLQL